MSRWWDLAFYAGKRFVDYYFLGSSWPRFLVLTGVGLIVAGFGFDHIVVSLTLIIGDQMFDFNLDANSPLSLWPHFAGWTGMLLVVVGLISGIYSYFCDRNRERKQRIIVLEHRGLHQSVDTPLSEAVCKRLEGQIDRMPIDHRQATNTSHISNPDDALSQISSLRQQIRQKRDTSDSGNVKVVYGGIAPVPFTFLAGMMIGDESDVIVMDWDRNTGTWRGLDDADDGERFVVSGLDDLPSDATEVAIAIAVSYSIDIENIQNTIGGLPVISAKLPTLNVSAHFSHDKQQALKQTFQTLIRDLLERKVRQIHLFIAAPNSVVFNLGRHYDDRLHPGAVVYQYEPSENPPFPWSVRLPTHGQSAQIVKSRCS